VAAGRRNSESRKELEKKELEEKRARGGKELEETTKKRNLLSPLYNPVHPVQTKLKNGRCLRYVARSPLYNPTHPAQTKLKNGRCLRYVARKTPSVRRTKPSSHASLSLVHLPEVNARERANSVKVDGCFVMFDEDDHHRYIPHIVNRLSNHERLQTSPLLFCLGL
jgi:hypothetical protein